MCLFFNKKLIVSKFFEKIYQLDSFESSTTSVWKYLKVTIFWSRQSKNSTRLLLQIISGSSLKKFCLTVFESLLKREEVFKVDKTLFQQHWLTFQKEKKTNLFHLKKKKKNWLYRIDKVQQQCKQIHFFTPYNYPWTSWWKKFLTIPFTYTFDVMLHQLYLRKNNFQYNKNGFIRWVFLFIFNWFGDKKNTHRIYSFKKKEWASLALPITFLKLFKQQKCHFLNSDTFWETIRSKINQ